MNPGGVSAADRHVDGVVEMMLDATQRYREPLTAERFFGVARGDVPTGRSGMTPIAVGAWRDDRSGPTQVVSGPMGSERVHFEAPPAERVDAEMTTFMQWFDRQTPGDPVLKAAIAHLWFVTIHPYGRLTSSKWAKFARCSSDSALRDITDLVARGILVREGGGRSTAYRLRLDDDGAASR